MYAGHGWHWQWRRSWPTFGWAAVCRMEFDCARACCGGICSGLYSRPDGDNAVCSASRAGDAQPQPAAVRATKGTRACGRLARLRRPHGAGARSLQPQPAPRPAPQPQPASCGHTRPTPQSQPPPLASRSQQPTLRTIQRAPLELNTPCIANARTSTVSPLELSNALRIATQPRPPPRPPPQLQEAADCPAIPQIRGQHARSKRSGRRLHTRKHLQTRLRPGMPHGGHFTGRRCRRRITGCSARCRRPTDDAASRRP